VLEQYVKDRLAQRGMLLMTHIVMGHPDFDTSLRLIETMVQADVDLMELQIPFSEPIADGPVILRANQEGLNSGATVERCFDLAFQVAQRFDLPFLFMTYYNVVFRQGVGRFAERMHAAQIRGAIVPDLPPEEGTDYLKAMTENELAPILIFAPNTKATRMKELAQHGRGFIYCAARKGVTGSETSFSSEVTDYLARARAATSLPLAVGFGVKEKRDVDFLRGKADIAVVGSETLRVLDKSGVEGVGPFLKSLR
jgi:tryptophan synthase alpha chain